MSSLHASMKSLALLTATIIWSVHGSFVTNPTPRTNLHYLSPSIVVANENPKSSTPMTMKPTRLEDDEKDKTVAAQPNRRDVFRQMGICVMSSFIATQANIVAAADDLVEMKTFNDPKGLFSIRVPKKFYTLRRSAKGDLPDAKTGKGRRGASIFTAGDMAKAEVVAVERFPTAVFLQDVGIVPTGDLSTFSSLGDPYTIANLLNLRRESDKPGQSQTTIIKDSVQLSPDGKTLTFSMNTKIQVQKPEMLMETMGIDELVRVTLAKAELSGDDGYIMACYASALKQDFDGVDGKALREVIDSFTVLKQPVPA